MKKLLITAISSVVALGLSAGAAQAGTAECNLSDVTANILGGVANADACVGEYETNSDEWDFNNDVLGNGDPLLSKLNELFKVDYEWSFVNKDESTGANAGLDGFAGAKSGTWSVDEPLEGPFAISLKGSDGFSVYLFDSLTQAVSSGTWTTLGLENNGGRQPNLSHFSLFAAKAPICTENCDTEVPEPGLAIGLGAMALGAIKARKRG
jgi:hypothetical protein